MSLTTQDRDAGRLTRAEQNEARSARTAAASRAIEAAQRVEAATQALVSAADDLIGAGSAAASAHALLDADPLLDTPAANLGVTGDVRAYLARELARFVDSRGTHNVRDLTSSVRARMATAEA